MVNDVIHIDGLLLIVIHIHNTFHMLCWRLEYVRVGIFAGLVHEYSGPPAAAGARVLTVQNFLALMIT